jgi:hypothetical protein
MFLSYFSYPNANQYRSMGKAILKMLNINKDIEALVNKFLFPAIKNKTSIASSAQTMENITLLASNYD